MKYFALHLELDKCPRNVIFIIFIIMTISGIYYCQTNYLNATMHLLMNLQSAQGWIVPSQFQLMSDRPAEMGLQDLLPR